MIDRAIIVCSAWALGLVLFNPLLEGRKRAIAALGLAIAASVLFIFRDFR